MKNIYLVLFLLLGSFSLAAQADRVSVEKNADGMRLVVNGEDFMINGMNWDYFPIGTNYSYSLWKQPDDIVRAALDAEMSLLKNMGVNAVRMYTGVPAKWIKYIHKKYGIYTMLNHSFGRYGLTLDGTYIPNTEYGEERVREFLLAEVKQLAEDYKNTPGLLLFLLGNENNYGLFWEGAETEEIPIKDRKSTKRARAMYKVFDEAAVIMKNIDPNHPVAMCNGDLLFMDIIVEECQNVDIYGTNMYRGVSFGDAFDRVNKEFNKPILFTEFGSDAFNAVANQEDQRAQAYYMVNNWREIYENAAGLGKAGNSIGGFTFQFSDGWWKFGQTKNLSVHDNNASWPNGGYDFDFVEGENNMNEEWFGICAKGPTNQRGLYQLYPRAAYYALKEAHAVNPMAEGTTLESLGAHFNSIQLMSAVVKARGDKAALIGEKLKKVRVSEMRADIRTFNTGGERITTGREVTSTADATTTFPDALGFDHMQSYFFGIEAKPSESVRANVAFNVLGNVPTNPINEIFYENRGRPTAVQLANGDTRLTTFDRFQVYQADFTWNHSQFDVTGFYRTGHYHWGYEGDFFGLYPEANYGPNIDIYNGEAPFGFEVDMKKKLKGLKIAFGPQLWWGANPAVLAKYTRKVKGFEVTALYHEDIDNQSPAVSSFAIPIPQTRRASLAVEREFGKLGIQFGGLWANSNRIGETFQVVDPRGEGSNKVFEDRTNRGDTWGGKAKVTYSAGRVNWYAQGAAMGILAQGGADLTQTFTGWKLKDSGSGNQVNFLTGFTLGIGDLQIAPNFLWQRPIEDPIPTGLDAPARPRNILDDPFAVRWNREMIAGEILFTYDPTPGTWMYQWDNDRAEDAKFAVSAGLVYRHQPTTMDAAIGIFADGRTVFAFPGAVPAQDLWEAHARIVNKLSPDFGMITNIYGGTAQARGSDPRLIRRYGGDIRMIYKKIKATGMVKVNDWGPFDYHRDFNLTYPLQLVLDVSTTLGKPKWFDLPGSRLGVRYTWRSLDQYSPRYCPTTSVNAAGQFVCDPLAVGFEDGTEWELQTYFQINLSN